MKSRPGRAWVPSLLLVAGACGLLVATFLEWHSGLNIEGAYFNRSTGAPAYAGVFSGWGHGDNAWQSFSGLDVALGAFAGLALLAAFGAFRSAPSRLRTGVSVATAAAGLGVGAWMLERVFDRPALVGLGPGPVVGFASVAVAFVGAALALQTRAGTRVDAA